MAPYSSLITSISSIDSIFDEPAPRVPCKFLRIQAGCVRSDSRNSPAIFGAFSSESSFVTKRVNSYNEIASFLSASSMRHKSRKSLGLVLMPKRSRATRNCDRVSGSSSSGALGL